ncbi:MAG: ABC transporter substrate-binding protein [Sphingobium sp.]|nr:ABC transporter substrate-binding protein [Sphingobium sp.]
MNPYMDDCKDKTEQRMGEVALRKYARAILIGLGIMSLASAGAAVIFTQKNDLRKLAKDERHLVIYSATDEGEAAELLDAFRKRYPFISVDYRSLAARDVYGRFKAESDAGRNVADLVINSAMDLQIKLVNDRYAQAYRSPERHTLPDWAVWKDQAFAVSAEPIVIGYNPQLLPTSTVPKTHDELAVLLHRNPQVLAGRIGSYDPLLSPTGYLYVTQDVHMDSDAWDLIGAIGRARPKLYQSSKTMISDVSSGRLALAYNVIGSYAFERAAHDPNFQVVVPRDYVLMMSRVTLIARRAPHPASAKLFLNFMLSREGQALLAKHHMNPVRLDMAPDDKALVGANVRAVRVGPALMANIDAMTFARFTRKWREAASERPPTKTNS